VRDLKTYFYTSRGIVRAVDGVSLLVQKGKAVGLVGESGSGKTVTALSIMRLVPLPGKIVEGSIHFGKKDVLSLSRKDLRMMRGRDISMVFQDPMTYLNPVMKIGSQINETLMLHQKVGERTATRMAIKVLESVGMPAPARVISAYPHELSGGMRQRVLFAIALACNPMLLILDEPTTALDVTIQAQILELISQIREYQGISQIVITHDLGIVAEVCDEVYVMYAGKIVEHADVFELYENPLHPYTKGLLESVLSIDEFKKKLVSIEGTVPSLIDVPIGCRFAARCSFAMKTCMEKESSLILGSGGHEVACWLYSEEEKK
jgi:peptide/nickel transport system ATP-binding protein